MKGQKAFSLIEMLVVVLIIAVLAVIAFPQYQKVITHVRNREAISGMRHIGRGIELYDLINGPLPESKSGDFSMLDIKVEKSKNWSYYFYCYDEFKSCFVWANPTQKAKIGEAQYYLQLSLHKGVMDTEIKVKQSVLVSEEKDENGIVVGQTSVASEAGEEICKQAGGKRIEVIDGHVCILK